MVAVERRLEQVETALSGRDRARLYIRAITQGGEPDQRLTQHCPSAERSVMDRITDAVSAGVQETWQRLLITVEWLNNDDISMGWLESIAGFVERERMLRKLAGPGARGVAAMQAPGRGFIRDIPMFWGVPSNVPEAPPATWAEAVPFLSCELRRSMEVRHGETVAFDIAMREASAALGEEISHPEVARAQEACRVKIWDIHQALQRFERFELPEPTEAMLATARGLWNMEALRENDDPANARSMLFASRREELEAWEREQAELLHGGTA